MSSPDEIEAKISELLDNYYMRRMAKINDLKLIEALKRKNPYLYRANGVEDASEIIEQLLAAYMSSSDEGIFGDAFFEPLAKFVSGGSVSATEGVDIIIETSTTYKAIAVKSGTSVFNSDSLKRQQQNFESLGARIQKLHKHYDPIIGYCYGKKKPRKLSQIRKLAGQDFWMEITGDSEFYLKIIRLMKNKPQEHIPLYKKSLGAAINRFTKEFVEKFCDENGCINWDKLLAFNSGNEN
jgi:hypothetical protein